MKPQNFFLIAALILLTSCSVMCNKKSSLKKTRWTCEYQEFIADAGNETVTVTLEFVSAKDYVMVVNRHLPPYPAMYMNADGTVDTMPGHDSEYTVKGTYVSNNNVITLTPEDGAPKTLLLEQGKLLSKDISYQPLTFSREDVK